MTPGPASRLGRWRWIVPAVDLSSDSSELQWRYPASPRGAQVAGGRRPISDALDRFVRLAELARRGDIRALHLERLARDWGVFHGRGRAGPGEAGADRVESWIKASAALGSVIRLAGALQSGSVARRVDIQRVVSVCLDSGVASAQRTAALASMSRQPPPQNLRALIATALDCILADAGVRPTLVRAPKSPLGLREDLVPHDMSSALAIALLRRIQGAGSEGARPCAVCGTPTIPKRQSVARQTFCDRCRSDKRTRARERKQAERDRKRASR